MSQYGPPGGPGNGPFGGPNEPYQGSPGGFGPGPGGGEHDPFGGRPPEPAPPGDPFGQPGPPPPYLGGPGDLGPGGPGGFGPGGPGGPGGFGMPENLGGPQEPKKGKGGLIVVLVIVLVVVLGGGGAGWYFLFGPGKSDKSSSADKKSGDKKADTSASAAPKGEQGPAVGVKKGDCVVHPADSNTVKPAACTAPGALKVYDRIAGTNASKCKTPPTDFTYVYKDNVGTDNFVLCLQKQDGASAQPSASNG